MSKVVSAFLLVFVAVLVFFVASICTGHIAQAQITSTTRTSIDATPAYPTAGDSVRLKFKTYSIEVGSSEITWTIDGTVVQQGVAKDLHTFTAGPTGSVHHVTVRAVSASGEVVQTTTTLTVNDVAFAWEAHAYSPPFFQGRTLKAAGAAITLFAVPSIVDSQGRLLDAENLLYEWNLTSDIQGEYRGLGLTSITTISKRGYSDVAGSLTIRSKSGAVLIERFFSVPDVVPHVLLYEDDPLLGAQYATPITGAHRLMKNELRILAEPYYMSAGTTRTMSNLVYDWRVGDTEYGTPGSLLLRPEGDGQGSTFIELTIRNTSQMLQSARAQLTVTYTAGDSSAQNNTTTNPL